MIQKKVYRTYLGLLHMVSAWFLRVCRQRQLEITMFFKLKKYEYFFVLKPGENSQIHLGQFRCFDVRVDAHHTRAVLKIIPPYFTCIHVCVLGPNEVDLHRKLATTYPKEVVKLFRQRKFCVSCTVNLWHIHVLTCCQLVLTHLSSVVFCMHSTIGAIGWKVQQKLAPDHPKQFTKLFPAK